jgi:hypothetical protein
MCKITFFIGVLLMMTSCSSIYNYQVYQTEGPNLKIKNDLLVFEDSVCSISYNLWSENGNPTFLFFNKTDQLISIDLTECFFVMNGISFDYFQNRTYTYSSETASTSGRGISTATTNSVATATNSATSTSSYFGKMLINSNGNASIHSNSTTQFSGASTTNSRGYSVSYSEQNLIKIPSKTGKIISEFSIVSSRFKHCELQKNPKNNVQIDSLQFTLDNSPIVFSNNITYQIETLSNSKKTVQNSFYVSSILNMVEEQFYYMDYEHGCSGKSTFKSRFLKYNSPKNFYLTYPID